MQKQSALTVFACALLAGCGLVNPPPCDDVGEPRYAPSAGCFSTRDGALLVVENFRGQIAPPGGSSMDDESAQCTAQREAWEETGLWLKPTKHLATFDTGFFLYLCERSEDSGEIDPPFRMEVERAFYLPLEDFDEVDWRFPGQDERLRKLLEDLTHSDPPTPALPPTPPGKN